MPIRTAFYEAVMARVIEKVTEVKHFDLYFNQYFQEGENGENEDSFPLTAVFFEYNPAQWDNVGKNKQVTAQTFSLHVINSVIQDVSNRETPTIRNKGHAHMLIIDKIVACLQGFNGTDFGAISRTSDKPYHMAKDDRIVDIIDFKSRLTDRAAMPVMQHLDKKDVVLVITPDLDGDANEVEDD